jgi:hypothetical protein
MRRILCSKRSHNFLRQCQTNAAQNLSSWFLDHDIIINKKVRIGTSTSGLRGLYATDSIAPREAIAVIPPKMIISSPFETLDQAVRTSIQYLDSDLQKHVLSVIPTVIDVIPENNLLVALQLLEQIHLKPDTWLTYKNIFLPERIPNRFHLTEVEMRSILKQKDLAYGISKDSVDKIAEQLHQFQSRFAQIGPMLEWIARLVIPSVDISQEQLSWALSVASSRAIATSSKSAQLIPCFDMINHSERNNSCIFVTWEQLLASHPNTPLSLRDSHVKQRAHTILQLDSRLALISDDGGFFVPNPATVASGPAAAAAGLEPGDKVRLVRTDTATESMTGGANARGRAASRARQGGGTHRSSRWADAAADPLRAGRESGTLAIVVAGPAGPGEMRVRYRGAERTVALSDVSVVWRRRPPAPPAAVSAAAGGGQPRHSLALDGRRLGDVDACVVVMARGAGVEPGQEVLYTYRQPPGRGSSSGEDLQYGLELLFTYGFLPRLGRL